MKLGISNAFGKKLGMRLGEVFNPRQYGDLYFSWFGYNLSGNVGDAISSFLDESGNNNNPVQSNSNNKPVVAIVNGVKVARFDGTNDDLILSNSTVPAQAPLTFYAVVSTNLTNPASTRRIASFQAGGGVGWGFGIKNPLGSPAIVTWGVKGYDNDSPMFVSGTAVICGMRFNSDYSIDEMVNGILQVTVTGTANAGSGAVNFRIGSSADGTECWNGDMYALLIYRGAHTLQQIKTITQFLSIHCKVNSNTVLNAPTYQTTPTYDGSGQVVHPSVYYRADGWNGFSYWMAMTPFPGGDASKENPSILASNDGDNWIVPNGLTNPIDARPGANYNSDAEIVMDANDLLWCVYRETDGSTYDKLKVRSSSDGVIWSAETEILSGAFSSLLSPSVVWDGSQFVMWSVNRSGTFPYQHVERRTCAAPTGTWSSGVDITFANKPNQNFGMWHVCTRLNGTTYQMLLLSETVSGFCLTYLTGNDGKSWTFDTRFFLMKMPGFWDGSQMYRASFVDMGTYLDIWYSAKDVNSVWHIGRTSFVK